MTTETRKFTLHPLAIHTFIQAQAGTLAKALAEAAMNSFDAFATVVDVELTQRGFTVSDDGQGFRTRDEIAAWFETLGFPHDEGNHRVWGKFGMGRAQAWAFARTKWRTNSFEMDVDVKKSGLDYLLRETAVPYRGTRIEGEFYTPLSLPDLERNKREFEALVRFMPNRVTLNETAINKDPVFQTWTHESPEAWFNLSTPKNTRDSGLTVYNAGVLVATYPHYTFRCSGIVVTKPESPLALNLARNEILEAQCPVWKKVRATLATLVAPKAPAAPARKKADSSEMAALAAALAAGTKTLTEVLAVAPEMLVSVLGRPIAPDRVVSYRTLPVLLVPKGDEAGKRLSKTKQAVVLAKESLSMLGLPDMAALKAHVLADMLSRTKSWHDSYRETVRAQMSGCVWSDKPEEVFPEFYEGKVLFNFNELSDTEKACMSAWKGSWPTVAGALRTTAPSKEIAEIFRSSAVQAGDAPTSSVWVNQSQRLFVMRKRDVVAGMTKSLPLLSKFVMLTVQNICIEVCADEAVGKEMFVAAVTQTDLVGRLLPALLRGYIQACAEHKVAPADCILEGLEGLEPVSEPVGLALAA